MVMTGAHGEALVSKGVQGISNQYCHRQGQKIGGGWRRSRPCFGRNGLVGGRGWRRCLGEGRGWRRCRPCLGRLEVDLGRGLGLGGGPKRSRVLALDPCVANRRRPHCHGRAQDGRERVTVGGGRGAVPTAAAPTTRAAASCWRQSSAGRARRSRPATSPLAPNAVAPWPRRPRACSPRRARTPPT